jgi:hypothetical protein
MDHVRAFNATNAVIIVTELVCKAKLFVGRNFTENTLISVESKHSAAVHIQAVKLYNARDKASHIEMDIQQIYLAITLKRYCF